MGSCSDFADPTPVASTDAMVLFELIPIVNCMAFKAIA